MERTKIDRLNGAAAVPPIQHEPFSIADSATGKSRPVREMTDQEIALHIATASQQSVQNQNVMIQTINNLLSSNQMLSVLQFEQHRRSVSLTVVSDMPRTNQPA